jgi:hypothetical protein
VGVKLAAQEEVLSWREETLAKAGYDSYAATLLADSAADLHLAVWLIKQGCPVETALRILL